MADKTETTSGGIGFCGLLTVLFIGLKLTDHIDWSWLWVLSPLWLPFAFIFAVLGLVLTMLLIVGVINTVTGR